MTPLVVARERPKLSATYRVQLNKAFGFAQARAMVPYLDRLGISHLYCSPVLRARAGSMHGYDVADPTMVSPELGGEAEWRALADAVHARGMGLLLDIVPNHMGIGADNPFWEDVLTHGERSRWAHWFDIDWERHRGATGAARGGRIVLPVLGDEPDAALDRRELRFQIDDGRARIHYFDSSWPVDPATLPEELQLAQWDPTAVKDVNALFRSEGHEGREHVRALMDAQHYRLVHWRRGPDEINYRRFFDVNDLIALRMEDPRVFDETHALVLRWVDEGLVDGLRIDHIDGLLDPLAYLERLRARVDRDSVLGTRDSGLPSLESRVPSPAPFPILVEKILSPGEQLPVEWPVQGTTGYEFLDDVEDTLVDPRGYARIEDAYRRMRRLPPSSTFAELAREGKLAILRGPLRADVHRLAALLRPLVDDTPARDWPAARLEAGIVAFIAALPVYRSYIDGRAADIGDADRVVIEQAVSTARAHVGDREVAEAVVLVGDVVLGRVGRSDQAAWLRFVQRLQQTSGPATAKGIEDTALYVYVPLVSRNEVGGAPDRPLADAAGRLHAGNATRAAHWPLALLCTNTHDTKRSADVRARLDVLSDMPRDWELHLQRWRRLNRKHKSVVRGRIAPDANTEYLLYQTLLGIWPAPRPGRRSDDLPDRAWRQSATQRLTEYMLKAAREAKLRTSWTDPDAGFEEALRAFVAAMMEPGDDAPFLSDVARLVSRIAPLGHRKSLARMLVHAASPGVTDLYQGDELWNLALVDPDNRRPVDYERRRAVLGALSEELRGDDEGDDLATLARDLGAPRLKLLVATRLLRARRADPELFTRGSYRALTLARESVEAGETEPLFAFARSREGRYAIAIASGRPPRTRSGRWGTTALELPAELRGRRWRSVLDDAPMQGAPEERLAIGPLLDPLPIALLMSV